MTPTDFAKWQEQNIENGEIPLTKEDFEIAMDMMAMQNITDYNPNDEETKKNTISIQDGMALVQTKSGLKVYYTDLDTIKYEQLKRKQSKREFNKTKFTIVK